MAFQAKLTTKFKELSVDDAVVEIGNDTDSEFLNSIVNALLKQVRDDLEGKRIKFDFLIGGRLLRLTVEKHLELYSDEIDARAILSENLVDIEYFPFQDAPKPENSIPHDDWVSCIDANDSIIISGTYQGTITMHDSYGKELLGTLENAHKLPITDVRLLNQMNSNKDAVYFVTCSHDETSVVRRYDKVTGQFGVILCCKGHSRSVNCLDTHDNLMVTGSYDKTLRIWGIDIDDLADDPKEANHSAESKKKPRNKKQKTKASEKATPSVDVQRSAIATLTGHVDAITSVKWLKESSSGPNRVATCSLDKTIHLWDIEVGESTSKLLSSKPLVDLDHSAENNLFIGAACDKNIRTWDARAPDNATARTAYISHRAWVSSVAFGPNPFNFISGGHDNLVKFWDLRSPKACLYDLIGHHDKVLVVNWSNPSLSLSGSADSTLKIFEHKNKLAAS